MITSIGIVSYYRKTAIDGLYDFGIVMACVAILVTLCLIVSLWFNQKAKDRIVFFITNSLIKSLLLLGLHANIVLKANKDEYLLIGMLMTFDIFIEGLIYKKMLVLPKMNKFLFALITNIPVIFILLFMYPYLERLLNTFASAVNYL